VSRRPHLLCLGRETLIVLVDARELEPPKTYGLLFDPSGKNWPRCSLLIAPYEEGTREVSPPRGLARDYFGDDAKIYRGEVKLPPRKLGAWQPLGEVDALYYDRTGTAHRGYFRHRFYAPRGLYRLLFLVKAKKRDEHPVIVYEYGEALRIDMPAGCIVDDRGIVMP
jgi:hypothetical protein